VLLASYVVQKTQQTLGQSQKDRERNIAEPKRKANHNAGSCDGAAVWIPLDCLQKRRILLLEVMSANPLSPSRLAFLEST
jgi:hypothetical protein